MFKINRILKEEEGFMFLLSIYLFSELSFKWWVFPMLLLLPDIGMLGYLINNKIGALTYNLLHHKGIAIFLYLIGIYYSEQIMELSGIIIFGHASLDRLFGYGLKYPDGFKHTHLGYLPSRNKTA